MVKRLPMSLKFDDESKFYQDFIKEKQNNLELSSFVVELLEAYFHDEEVQKHVDEYFKQQNPHLKIYEEISRIGLEYNKHVTSLNMLGDYNTNAKKEYNKNKKKKEKRQNQEERPKKLSKLEELQELERLTEKFGLKIEGNKIKKTNVSVDESNTTQELEEERIKLNKTSEKTKKEELQTVEIEEFDMNEETEEETKEEIKEEIKETEETEEETKIVSNSAMSKLMGSLNG